MQEIYKYYFVKARYNLPLLKFFDYFNIIILYHYYSLPGYHERLIRYFYYHLCMIYLDLYSRLPKPISYTLPHYSQHFWQIILNFFLSFKTFWASTKFWNFYCVAIYDLDPHPKNALYNYDLDPHPRIPPIYDLDLHPRTPPIYYLDPHPRTTPIYVLDPHPRIPPTYMTLTHIQGTPLYIINVLLLLLPSE